MPTKKQIVPSYRDIEAVLKKSPARVDPTDERDFAAGDILKDVKLPATYDLRASQSPIKVQGDRGTCTAFATTAIAEFFNRKELGDDTLDLSEEFLFKKTKEIDVADYGYDGYGAYLRSAAKAYQKYGLCRDATLPYRASAAEKSWDKLTLTAAQETEAADYRAESYVSVATDETAIKTALVASGTPLIAGFTLYSSYRKSSDASGLIPVRTDQEQEVGGHAMAIVGYTATHFILKNSWGNAWGDGGYVYWPFASIGDVFSAWGFVDAKNPNVKAGNLTSAKVRRFPAWSQSAVAWAMKEGLITQPTGETMTDYRLAVILQKFDERMARLYKKN